MDQIGTKLDPAESAGGLRGCLLPLTWLLVTLVVVLVCVAFIFGVVVRPGEMGVRETTLRLPFGPKQGYSASGLKPGFHWRIPIYSRIHFVPQVLQILDLDRESVGTKGAIGALEVQTTDGSSVDVDVSVLYRYCSERGPDHGGPAELLNVVGFEKDWLLHIQTVVTNELRKVLGRLSASEFYNPVRREKEVTEAQEEMNKRLKPAGIMVEGILLRRYTYAATIDEAIFAKNLKDQEPQLRSAESRLADAKAQVEKVRAEWSAKIKTLGVHGENRARVLHSEGDLYEAQKNAEGDLFVAKAKAEVDRLRADALAAKGGGDVYVARELAPLLSSLKGGVIGQIDPYNFEEWLKRFGIAGATGTRSEGGAVLEVREAKP